MLLERLFWASSPMWEKERKEQGQLEGRGWESSWPPGSAEAPSAPDPPRGRVPKQMSEDVLSISRGTDPSPRAVCVRQLGLALGQRQAEAKAGARRTLPLRNEN